eukprot:NODE_154_length_15322_cov_0.584510.p1 type:complete len:676 gc:universal NODE_154_length_15322_cov_0.584510:11816-9789(-)
MNKEKNPTHKSQPSRESRHKSQPSRESKHRSQPSKESQFFRERQESFGNINVLNLLPFMFRRFSTGDELVPESDIGLEWKKIWVNFKLLLKYNVSSLSRSIQSFMIGLSAVFLVVLFVILINNLQTHLQYFNLKSIEDLVSSTDVVVSSNDVTNSPFLNYTQLKRQLLNTSGIDKIAPRWILPINVVNSLNKKTSKAIAVIIDSTLEDDNEIAPLWNKRPLGSNEMHCSDSLIRNLNLLPNSGNTLDITLNLTGFQQANISKNADFTIPLGNGLLPDTTVQVLNALQLGLTLRNTGNQTFLVVPNTFVTNFGATSISFQVIDAIAKTDGKYASALGNVVLLDKSAVGYIVKSILSAASLAIGGSNNVNDLASNITSQVNMEEFVAFINIIMKDRYDIYLSSTKERQGSIINLANAIAENIGIYSSAILTPVISLALDNAQFLSFIFNEIFFSIIFILIILAIAVIYSLMNKDVHEKTYEYGMLRSLGLQQSSLIALLLQKSLLFAVPGILTSLMFSYIFNLPIAFYVSQSVGNDIASALQGWSVVLGVVIGIFLPLLGIILPIRRALGTTLRDALDLYHSSVEETKITIQKLKSYGLSPVETTMSILFVIFGFLVYYVLPTNIDDTFSIRFSRFHLVLSGLHLDFNGAYNWTHNYWTVSSCPIRNHFCIPYHQII